MIWIILLFVLGIALIVLEVIVPGGILGGIGALLMLAGSVVACVHYGVTGGAIATFSALAIGAVLLWIEFHVLPKTKVGRRAFLMSEIKGTSSDFGEQAHKLIGQRGKALTTLAPSGYIDIAGKRYEAFCQEGLVTAGTELEVLAADNFRLIVSPTTNPQYHG